MAVAEEIVAFRLTPEDSEEAQELALEFLKIMCERNISLNAGMQALLLAASSAMIDNVGLSDPVAIGKVIGEGAYWMAGQLVAESGVAGHA